MLWRGQTIPGVGLTQSSGNYGSIKALVKIGRCRVQEIDVGIRSDKICQRHPVQQVRRNLDVTVQTGRNLQIKIQAVGHQGLRHRKSELQLECVTRHKTDTTSGETLPPSHCIGFYDIGCVLQFNRCHPIGPAVGSRSLIPNSAVQLIPNTGHFPIVSRRTVILASALVMC